jgi:hypothetical protein
MQRRGSDVRSSRSDCGSSVVEHVDREYSVQIASHPTCMLHDWIPNACYTVMYNIIAENSFDPQSQLSAPMPLCFTNNGTLKQVQTF